MQLNPEHIYKNFLVRAKYMLLCSVESYKNVRDQIAQSDRTKLEITKCKFDKWIEDWTRIFRRV